MNDENNDQVEPINNELTIALSLNAELQDEVDALGTALADKMELVSQLETEALAGTVELAVAPAGDAELRALAVTVRTAQRAGHPDVGKHMDALLTALGAV